MMNLDEFRLRMARDGYAIFPRVVPEALLARIRSAIPAHIDYCHAWKVRNGIATEMDGSAHHVLGHGDALDEFLLLRELDDYIHDYFRPGKYILNSYGAINNQSAQAGSGYAHGARYHRDVRTYVRDIHLMLNMLVMINDFTFENGATKLVPGSHGEARRPTEAEMEQRAVSAIGPAGSILLFDSNLWHSAAPNTTTLPRMALTLTFTCPFVKQQLDYPRLLGEGYTRDERLRQLLGYNARVPTNHNEWYQPPERRMYKPGQG